jgi:putative transposase
MPFNPAEHHRHSIRLRGYDYSRPGAYFVTLCVRGRECLFGKIENGDIVLNDAGEFAKMCWVAIPEHFPHVKLDEFVIMPDHVHGILIFRDFPAVIAGATESVAPEHGILHYPNWTTNFTNWTTESVAPTGDDGKNELRKRPHGPATGSLGAIIGQYKSVVTKRINALYQTPGKIRWQRDFYDHIGRDAKELFRIRKYIRENPVKWFDDGENPSGKAPTILAQGEGLSDP